MGNEDYNENDLELYEPGTPEYSRIYDIRYLRKLQEITGGIDPNERDEVMKEMETMRYNPSNQPELDIELNFLKSQNERKRKQHRFGRAEESYLQFQAEESGKSLAEVKKEAMKTLKEGGSR